MISAEQIREIRWDDDVLPLCNNRYPFMDLSDRVLNGFAHYLEIFPESIGRMSRAIRNNAGLIGPCPSKFVTKEAHIDISQAPYDIEEELLIRGFEPDHFMTLNPSEYLNCYTMRLECPLGASLRIKQCHSYMVSVLRDIQKMIEGKDGVFAYSEVETYSHSTCFRQDFRKIDSAGLERFPFLSEEFVVLSGAVGKRADVHVRIPMPEKGAEYVASGEPSVLQLKQLLLSSGFYEIRSLSGNCVYTVQMMDISSAKIVFSKIKSWAEQYGGITFVCLEVVSDFWRKEEMIFGREFKSPIPKIVARLIN